VVSIRSSRSFSRTNTRARRRGKKRSERGSTNRTREQQRAEARERQRERGRKIEDVETTRDIRDVYEAIEAIDVRDVARRFCTITDERGGDEPRFAAPWHDSHDSGTSCFANRERFVDLKSDDIDGGDALSLAALADGIIDPSGADYRKVCDALRDAGFHVPVLETGPFARAVLLPADVEPPDLRSASTVIGYRYSRSIIASFR
jgi:hypothetical protein